MSEEVKLLTIEEKAKYKLTPIYNYDFGPDAITIYRGKDEPCYLIAGHYAGRDKDGRGIQYKPLSMEEAEKIAAKLRGPEGKVVVKIL